MVENKITISYQIKVIKPSEREEGYVKVLMQPMALMKVLMLIILIHQVTLKCIQ